MDWLAQLTPSNGWLPLTVAVAALAVSGKSMWMSGRQEKQRLADRHDQEGPNFEVEPATLDIVGGPGPVLIDAAPASHLCSGLSTGRGPVGQSIRFPPLEPDDHLTLTAHLVVDPWKGHPYVSLTP
jgi:hypothetical protein